MENKLIEQMTNEQKAIDIAQWDGWEKPAPHSAFYQNEDKYAESYELTTYYLYDLNYLMPVAVKVRSVINNYDADNPLADVFMKLCYQMATYDKTPEGTYQPLFDAVYEAIVYFENQEQ